MAKPPPLVETMPRNSRSWLSDDRSASHSHWTALTNLGDQMTQLGSQMLQIGNQQSKPQRLDAIQLSAQMMQLGDQMMHVGSLFLEDASLAATTSAATAGERKISAQEQGPNANKRTRFGNPPVLASSFQSSHSFHAALGRTSAPVVTPSAGADIFNEQQIHPYFFPPVPNDEVDLNLWNFFSEEFGNVQPDNTVTTSATTVAATSAADDQDGMDKELALLHNEFAADGTSVKNVPSSNQSQEKTKDNAKEVKYLKKFVSYTVPKLILKMYLQQTNGDLICLCGRGGHNNHHPGNQNYLDLIKSRLQVYRSLSKKEKEEFTNSLVQEFEDQGRRFFKVNQDDEWEEMDKGSVRAKISQSFRDA